MSNNDPLGDPPLDRHGNIVDDYALAGGSLEGGIAGRYQFTIAGVLREAWEKTDGAKLPIGFGVAVVWLIFYVLTALLRFFGLLQDKGLPSDQFFAFALTLVSYPFVAGVTMMGIRRAVGLAISPWMVFGYLGATLPLLVCMLMISCMTWFGLLLLVIPGIYLQVAYVLAMPLVIEKGLSPWAAMEASRRAITHQWYKVFGLLLAIVGITLLSAIPFGIGLLWTLPMAMIAMGILYREVFGVEEARALAA